MAANGTAKNEGQDYSELGLLETILSYIIVSIYDSYDIHILLANCTSPQYLKMAANIYISYLFNHHMHSHKFAIMHE